MDEENLREKRMFSKEFSAVDVINKTYADSTEYDLNDTLIFLTKAINKTKIKNKQLVKQHFGKFVQCRVVLEEIWTDIRQKGYDREFTYELEENIKIIERKFREITSAVLDDSRNETNRDRREYYMKKYGRLFDVKNELRRNLGNLERFADVYEGARDMYEELKESRYVQGIWRSIHDERCEFLETVYRNIQRSRSSFYESLYYFDLYFRVCEHKTEDKIMNTLLVSFKEDTTKGLETGSLDRDRYLEGLTRQYLGLVRKVGSKIQVEGTRHYFHCMERVFEDSEAFFVKVWIKRLMDNVKVAGLSTNARNMYFVCLKKLKMRAIDNEFQDTLRVTVDTFGDAMDGLKHSFNLFVDVVSREEEGYLREKVLEGVRGCYDSMKLERFSDLERVTRDVYELRHLFGSRDSEAVKDLYKVMSGYMEDHMAKVIGTVSEKVEVGGSDASLLIEVVRIIEEMPMQYTRVVRRMRPLIDKYPVALHYLSSILEIDPPVLSNAQRMRVGEIEYQFGFLLNMD